MSRSTLVKSPKLLVEPAGPTFELLPLRLRSTWRRSGNMFEVVEIVKNVRDAACWNVIVGRIIQSLTTLFAPLLKSAPIQFEPELAKRGGASLSMTQPVAGVPSGLLLLINVQPSLCSWANVLSGGSKPSFKEAAATCDNDRE